MPSLAYNAVVQLEAMHRDENRIMLREFTVDDWTAVHVCAVLAVWGPSHTNLSQAEAVQEYGSAVTLQYKESPGTVPG